jgi:uncharacterized protein YjbI with pentapeptide repeats
MLIRMPPRPKPAPGPVVPDAPDLPAALEPFGMPADLRAASLERTIADRLALTGADAASVRIEQSRLSHVILDGATLANARFQDVVVTGGSWANSRAMGADFRRVRFEGVRMTGGNLAECALRDVSLVDCRAELTSYRFATLERVRFERCRLTESDFYGARFESVVFVDCDLSRALWAEATFQNSELRGCDISGAGNPERLRGVAMPWSDVLASAGELARAAGIVVLADGTRDADT